MNKPLKLRIRLPELSIESRSIRSFDPDREGPSHEDYEWLFCNVISRLPCARLQLLMAMIVCNLAEDGETETMDEESSQGFVDAAVRLIEWWERHDADLDRRVREDRDRGEKEL